MSRTADTVAKIGAKRLEFGRFVGRQHGAGVERNGREARGDGRVSDGADEGWRVVVGDGGRCGSRGGKSRSLARPSAAIQTLSNARVAGVVLSALAATNSSARSSNQKRTATQFCGTSSKAVSGFPAGAS